MSELTSKIWMMANVNAFIQGKPAQLPGIYPLARDHGTLFIVEIGGKKKVIADCTLDWVQYLISNGVKNLWLAVCLSVLVPFSETMGSWNDITFSEDEVKKQYQKACGDVCKAARIGILNAVNSFNAS